MAKVAVKITKDREEEIRRNAIWSVKNAEIELKKLQGELDKVRDATGISLDKWTPTERIISRIKAADSLDTINRNVRFIEMNTKEMMQYAQKIQTAVADINTKELVDADV